MNESSWSPGKQRLNHSNETGFFVQRKERKQMNLTKLQGIGAIHQDEEGRFSLNDLCDKAIASGIAKDIRPNEWMALQNTKELAEILITEKPGSNPLVAKPGRYGGTYAAKELIYDYAMWISA
jgi:hypothetical protein